MHLKLPLPRFKVIVLCVFLFFMAWWNFLEYSLHESHDLRLWRLEQIRRQEKIKLPGKAYPIKGYEDWK